MRCAIAMTCVVLLFGLGSVSAGDLEPPAPPAPTMKSLDEIAPTWSQTLDSTNGEPDGCNSSRFKCVYGNFAVLDMETGLVWQRLPGTGPYVQWVDRFQSCLQQATGDRGGWRLPTAEEFMSLIDYSTPGGNFPPSHPFTGYFFEVCHLSATSYVPDPSQAFGLGFSPDGTVAGLCVENKTNGSPIWCVRGGRGDASP
jgi:hypothetical protein